MSALPIIKRPFSIPFFLFLLTVIDLHAGGLPDFTHLVERYSPAVVNISTTQQRPLSRTFPPGFRIPDLPEGSPFNEFFRHFFEDGTHRGGEEEKFDAQSLGSGFIISKDGYILTNHHVVDGADEILVRLSDQREFEAEVIGSDKKSDMALLKIDADDLPVVKVGKSGTLKVGEWVLAIGSPFGFDHSATAGIVSAKGRSLPSENYVPFIQTDVAVNPGNSGGPLFNLDGEVVGVNSQIYSRTGGFMGLSFAIPIEMAMNVADQLRTRGHVTRGWLGVLIQDVTRELAESFSMPHPKGALIARVLPDSPAEKAGLKAGDVILRYNEKPLANSPMLPPLVGSSRVDQSVTLLVLRDGRERTLKVYIGELPADEVLGEGAGEKKTEHEDLLGLGLAELTAEQRGKFGLGGKDGVLVTRVRPGPGQKAGIRRGDVIQMFNRTPVKDLEGLRRLVEDLPKGKTASILIQRRTGPLFLALKLTDE